MEPINSKIKFKNVNINIEKNNYLLGKIEAFFGDLSNIPSLPGFRNEFLSLQTASGIHAILAWDGNLIPVEDIRQIEAGKSISYGRKSIEDEVRKMIDIRKKMYSEIIVENKKPEITPEFIKRLLIFSSNNPPPEEEIKFSKEQNEWLTGFCEFLEKDIPDFRGDDKTKGLLKAIITHAYFECKQPFSGASYRASQLLGFCLLLKSGVPYLATSLLPVFYYETKTDYQHHLGLLTKNEDISGFMQYSLTGFCEGLENIITTKLSQLFIITWQHYINLQLSTDEDTGAKVTKRRKELIQAFPLSNDNGLSFEQIVVLSTGIARTYARRNKTARRDLAALMELGLLIKRKRKYYPNVIAILGEMALNSSLIKVEMFVKKEPRYSHNVMPVVSSPELKSELLKMLGSLEGKD